MATKTNYEREKNRWGDWKITAELVPKIGGVWNDITENHSVPPQSVPLSSAQRRVSRNISVSPFLRKYSATEGFVKYHYGLGRMSKSLLIGPSPLPEKSPIHCQSSRSALFLNATAVDTL